MHALRSVSFTLFVSTLVLFGTASQIAEASDGLTRRRLLQAACGFGVVAVAHQVLTAPFATIDWEIIGPGGKILAEGMTPVEGKATVGSLTIERLKAAGLKFEGDADAIKSIDGTPTGDAAIEVISDTKMKAYGWCYEVNGIRPELMPGEYRFEGGRNHLRWFYAYSLYENGQWVSYCNPV